jgi:hypothetical protein
MIPEVKRFMIFVLFLQSIIYAVVLALLYPDILSVGIISVLFILAVLVHLYVYKDHLIR